MRKTFVVTLILVFSMMLSGICLASSSDPSTNLKYSIAVQSFENRSGWAGQWNISDAYGAVLTDILNKTGQFTVLGESDTTNTSAQLIVKGVITAVQNDGGQVGGVRLGGVLIGAAQGSSSVNITMYVVEVATGQVVASTSVVGKSNNGGTIIGLHNAFFGNSHKDNLGKAVEDAVNQGAQWMITQLPKLKWTGTVVTNNNGQIYINRGTRENVQAGQVFTVGEATQLRDPDTGEVLDEAFREVAKVQAVTVKDKVTICEVVTGDGNSISKGMRVLLPN